MTAMFFLHKTTNCASIFFGVFLIVLKQIALCGQPQVTGLTTKSTFEDSTKHTPSRFWQTSAMLDKKRVIGISAFAGVSYTTSMFILSKAWYEQYPQTGFHFFNDNAGWLQIDKIGHAWTAYMESQYAGALYQWGGVSGKKSAWIGAGIGLAFQSGIEILDGFSEGWGASPGDIAANTIGSVFYLGQKLAWGEQRIRVKFSAHKVNYGDFPAEVRQRAVELYGSSFSQTLLKDYNGQSYWLSVSPAAFAPHKSTHWPSYLSLAIGYGAENMFGAEQNIWQNKAGVTLNYNDIVRYRQYFLSLDLDLSRLPVRSPFLRTLLGALNVFKVPAPAVELNSSGKFRWHWLYF